MTPKTFLGLAAITLIAVVAASFAVLTQPTSAPVRYVDEPAFPALREDPDAVAKVTLKTADGSFSLLREAPGRWVTEDRFGYPVDEDHVRALIVALSDMRLIERKTTRPDRYPRLEVEDLDAEDANSRLLLLETADGRLLAEVYLGKQRYRLTGTEQSGTYLRRPEEAESWLASGSVPIEPEVVDWLERQIIDLDAENVQRIEIDRADEPGYVVQRDATGAPLQLAGLSEDETAKDQAELARLAGALTNLRLEDVQPEQQLAWPEERHRVSVRTFDGLEVTIDLAAIDEQYWASFDAREVEAVGASGAGAPDEEPAEPGGEAAASQIEDVALEGPDAAAVPSEAAAPIDPAELDARLEKWAYRIPQHVYDRLSAPRSEWLLDQDETS